MGKQTAAQVASKWVKNASNATSAYKEGVSAVDVSPTALAAQNIEKMKAGFIAAIDSGKTVRALNRVTLEEWKTKAINLGAVRYSGGVVAAQGKMENFMAEFLPHLDALHTKLKTMPSLTLDENINRLITTVRHNAEFKRKYSA